MKNCSDCAFAEWDYDPGYGGTRDYFFVSCQLDLEPEDDCPAHRPYEEE